MFDAGVAGVAVAAAKYHIDKAYSYLIPASMSDTAGVGVRVMVPFGGGNRPSEGIIISVSEKSGGEKMKAISAVLDPVPVVDSDNIKLALWMRGRYFCTLYDALRTMLPAGLGFTVRYSYRLNPEADYDASRLKSEDAKSVLSIISDLGGEADLRDIRSELSCDPDEALRLLMKRGLILSEAHEVRYGGGKTVRAVELCIPAEEALQAAESKRRRAPLQSEVLLLLVQAGSVSQKELCYFTGASAATVKALEKQGLVELREQEVLRRPAVEAARAEPMSLNGGQQKAFKGLRKLLKSDAPQAALLHGITGSGKTAVYIKLIEETLGMGRSAIVMVPEIALTPQLMGLFSAHFGDSVAVLHSSLKLGERYDEYMRIKGGAVNVVVGTRSAVFAPLKELGLVILDEEHEHTYKSESTPRYHARDIAKYLCVRDSALLLLGSATPCAESMYSAQTGTYGYFYLDARYNTQPLPKVIIADMRAELKEGKDAAVGTELLAELEANFRAGQQSILFVNRRGMSRMLTCAECGFVPSCPRCSVSLTYHAANGRMMCHYCGYSRQLDEKCPDCGGKMRHIGFGTQRVEEELHRLLPQAGLIRMDADTISASNTHENVLARFGRGEADILIGTQMVTKGLDFENVTLVGVLAADMSLFSDDFRAAERTFSLITQVIGRSGRGLHEGRAVIQTYTPKNDVIRLAAKQDYIGFYGREIAIREALGYPPFSELYAVTATGIDESAVLRVSTRMKETLSAWTPGGEMRILGPAPAKIARVNNRFRYRLNILCKGDKKARELISGLIREFSAGKENRGVFVYGDLNPLE